jgi:hypothetical protein
MTTASESATGLTPIFTFEGAGGLPGAGALVVVFELLSLQAANERRRQVSPVKIATLFIFTKKLSLVNWRFACQKPDCKGGPPVTSAAPAYARLLTSSK